jgi:hypothetical protein
MALTPIVYYTIFRHKNVRKLETIGSLLFFCVSIAQHVAIRYARSDIEDLGIPAVLRGKQ